MFYATHKIVTFLDVAMQLMSRGAMYTVLGGLVAALAWPATLLSATDFIDSKWAVAIDRFDPRQFRTCFL